MSALVLLATVIFFFNLRTPLVPLIYLFVPILVWAALRFGSKGVSTSVIVIAFAFIWGSIHGHGPFIGSDPLHNVLSLQLFLVLVAGPIMVLAVVIEESDQGRLVERGLRRRLISAQEQERIRIARELHDDVCQRLAMLSLKIEKAATYDRYGQVPLPERANMIEVGEGHRPVSPRPYTESGASRTHGGSKTEDESDHNTVRCLGAGTTPDPTS